MKLLITGIHGFVGSNLVAGFKANHIIYGLDIVSPPKDGVLKTFKWNELGMVPPVDCIIHLAGKAHDTRNTINDSEYFDINVGLTKVIFDYFLNSQTNKFIYFSSVKAVADTLSEGILTEKLNPKPKTPYGKSKLDAEKYIFSRQKEWEPKKSVFILRPSMIHGKGNKGNLNLLFKFVKSGLPWPLGAFENKRSFTSIPNLLFVLNLLIENKIASGIYNISDDNPISTNVLIQLFAGQIGKEIRIWKIPPVFVSFLSTLGDLLHLPVNTERLKKLTETYTVSNLKLKKALAIEKMPVDGIDGMISTINSFSENKSFVN